MCHTQKFPEKSARPFPICARSSRCLSNHGYEVRCVTNITNARYKNLPVTKNWWQGIRWLAPPLSGFWSREVIQTVLDLTHNVLYVLYKFSKSHVDLPEEVYAKQQWIMREWSRLWLCQTNMEVHFYSALSECWANLTTNKPAINNMISGLHSPENQTIPRPELHGALAAE